MDLPEICIPKEFELVRADRALAALLGTVTRSRIAKLIKAGKIFINGKPLSSSTLLRTGDKVEILSEPDGQTRDEIVHVPEFRILYEDDQLIVIDKPAGLVVHPGAGRASGTLMDKLVETRPDMIGVGQEGRWGIVHRLDRDTSGVIVVAKTHQAYECLAPQFRDHTTHRTYLAIVRTVPKEDTGTINAELGRHSKERKKISTRTKKGRRAVTRWKVLKRFRSITLLEITPETGRTHQIRVHLASIGLPVLGDQVYGLTRKTKKVSSSGKGYQLNRQALHAAQLGFIHPDGRTLYFSSDMPEDMAAIIRDQETSNE